MREKLSGTPHTMSGELRKKDTRQRLAESMRIAGSLRDAGYFVTDSNRLKWQRHSNAFVRDGVGSTFVLFLDDDDRHPITIVLSMSRESYVVQYR